MNVRTHGQAVNAPPVTFFIGRFICTPNLWVVHTWARVWFDGDEFCPRLGENGGRETCG